MTPSEAHNSAWQREPGHDAMQLAVMRAIGSELPKAPAFDRWDKYSCDCSLRSVVAEGMFAAKTGRTFFADLEAYYSGEQIREERGGKVSVRGEVWALFEIKPRIHSAGAVIRQVRVLSALMAQWSKERIGSTVNFACSVYVRPVVRADDPLAQTLADLFQSAIDTWDGARLGLLEPSFKLAIGKPGAAP